MPEKTRFLGDEKEGGEGRKGMISYPWLEGEDGGRIRLSTL